MEADVKRRFFSLRERENCNTPKSCLTPQSQGESKLDLPVGQSKFHLANFNVKQKREK